MTLESRHYGPRLSIVRHDPPRGYLPRFRAAEGADRCPPDVEVTVDGTTRPLCFEADATAGWARCYVLGDHDGALAVGANGRPRVVVLRGDVQIRRVPATDLV